MTIRKENKVTFIDSEGTEQKITLGMHDWQAAIDAKMGLRDYVNSKYPTLASVGSDTFTQMCASVGMYAKEDKKNGIRPISLHEIEAGGIGLSFAAGTNIVGSETSPVQSKILFPAYIAAVIEDAMAIDRTSIVSQLNRLVCLTTTVSGRRVQQPTVEYKRAKGPEEARNTQRAQGALPSIMMSITASEKEVRIPETPIAIEITDEAMQVTTLDFLTKTIQRQVLVEAYKRAGEDLALILNGNPDAGDYGTTALTTATAKSLDSTIATNGSITQKAWAAFLHAGSQYRTVDYVVTDLTGAMAINNRSGKPTLTTDDLARANNQYNVKDTLIFPNLINNVNIIALPDDFGWPANTLMALDSQWAIQKWVNTLATYSDVERYALRRASTYVTSFGSRLGRIYDDAFSVLTLTGN